MVKCGKTHRTGEPVSIIALSMIPIAVFIESSHLKIHTALGIFHKV